MTTKRTVKTRVDGVKQAYHVGKTVQAREAATPPRGVAPAPLAPAAKSTTTDFPAGYDAWGFSPEGIHTETGTQYSPDGWNLWGYDERGVSHAGWREDGSNIRTGKKYDENGLDVTGFDKTGLHSVTNTPYDPEGYDRRGWTATGEGRGTRDHGEFNDAGIHATTHTLRDPEGFGRNGWNAQGIHRETRTEWDPNGFNANRICAKTGTKYNLAGLDHIGFGRAKSSAHGRYSKEHLTARRERNFPKPGDPARKTPAEVWTPKPMTPKEHERMALRFAGNKWADGDFQTHREALVWVASLYEEGEEGRERVLALVDAMPLLPPGPPPWWTPVAPRGGGAGAESTASARSRPSGPPH